MEKIKFFLFVGQNYSFKLERCVQGDRFLGLNLKYSKLLVHNTYLMKVRLSHKVEATEMNPSSKFLKIFIIWKMLNFLFLDIEILFNPIPDGL